MPRLVRDLPTWLIYLMLALWGYFNYGFGPVVPLLRDEQGTSAALAGLHSTAIAAGAVAGGALYPVLSRRYGRGPVLWICQAVIAAGVLGFVFLPALFPVTIALTALIAVAGIAAIGGIVSALSEQHGAAGPAAISEANAAACAAGLVAPLVIGATMRAGLGWRAGMGVLVLLIALVAALAFVRRVRIPSGLTVAVPAQVAESVEAPAVGAAAGARQSLPGAYWLAWGMMTVTGAVEVVLSMWAASVLRDEVGLSAGAATAVMSAVVGGMFVGRLAGARIALRLPAIPLYFGALAVSLAGFAVFWTAGSAAAAVTGLIVIGLGNAMHYPVAISLAVAAAPGQADRAAGVAAYSMAVSFGVGPLLLGLVADQVGAHTAFLLIPVLIAGAAYLAWRFGHTAARRMTPDLVAEAA
ncbi:MFS transporter [Catellatospora sp. IY07-71]|uniref:MFS transporter n=1 Tax=Catellatospora sp. IY07-71 TaxID=2728827 RepID=UPI001BB3CEBF|nr:MFS transporter [Catellatospora sp. IY07-71]BCJ72339.1 MFS transporter [Catellatospora sp. IY07-71]